LVRIELFVAFLNRFGFFIVCSLHGTRGPYACLERSKWKSRRDWRGTSEVYNLWDK
jgi:hypothetical protein